MISSFIIFSGQFGLSREAQLFVGWVSGSVTWAGVGFHASTVRQKLTAEAQPTFILYLIPPTYLNGISLAIIRQRIYCLTVADEG
jgi:hypothetical protein